MIDFFASVTVASILVMTIVIVLSNYRQARILNEVHTVLDEWYQSHMRDRLETHRQEITISDPMNWFGRQAGVKITELSRVVETCNALEFLTNSEVRLVVSTLSIGKLRRKTRISIFGRGKLSRLVEPLLGNRMSKVKTIQRTTENSGEWFNVEAEAALRAMDINWGTINGLWFYLVPKGEKQRNSVLKFDSRQIKNWFQTNIEGFQKWIKKYFSKSLS